MKDFGSHDQFAPQSLVQEFIRETGVEMARLRAITAALKSLDIGEWQRTRQLAHDIAARAQALDLVVLATCARELDRLAGAIVTGDPEGQAAALPNAAIAIETIDLELGILSKGEQLS
jgi:hypothetical protein